MIEQKGFRGKLWVAFGMEQLVRMMLNISQSRKHGPKLSCRMRKEKGRKEHKVIDNWSRHSKRSWSLLGTAVTCAFKVY